MEKIKLYIHSEGSRDITLIEVNEETSHHEVIGIQIERSGINREEIKIFLEDGDEVQSEDDRDCSKLRHKDHIHCHRCDNVEVRVFYNGAEKTLVEPPSATTKNILQKAIDAFAIAKLDAATLLLKLEDETVLEPIDHVGSFVNYPNCKISLFLTPNKQVQG